VLSAGLSSGPGDDLRDRNASDKLPVADLLVEFPRGVRWLESEFVAKMPLALMVLMNSQMRLVEADVAPHEQAMHIFPAWVAGGQALAHRNAVGVSAHLEAHYRDAIKRLEMLHSQLFAVQQRPFLERRVLEQVTPVELQGRLVAAQRDLRPAAFLLARGIYRPAKASISSHRSTSGWSENPPRA